MKSIIITIISLFIFNVAFSQYEIKVSETHENFNKIGNKKAITVNIYDRDAQIIKKEWAKLMSTKYSSDKANWKNISFIDNVLIKGISKNTLDIYGVVKYSTDGVVTFSIAVDMGGIFLSEAKHNVEYAKMKKIMHNFAIGQSKKGLSEKIKMQKKTLAKYNKEKEKNNIEIQKLNSEIASFNKKIAENKASIQNLEQNNVNKQNQIEDQRKLLYDTQSIIIK